MLINNNKSSKTFKVLTLSFILKVRQGLHNMFQKPKTATTSSEQNICYTKSVFVYNKCAYIEKQGNNEFLIYFCWRRIFSIVKLFAKHVCQLIFLVYRKMLWMKQYAVKFISKLKVLLIKKQILCQWNTDALLIVCSWC